MSMPPNRFIPSPPIVRSEDLGAGARTPACPFGNPTWSLDTVQSPRTPDEGAHLVTRGIILNPRYGDPPPELPVSLATFSPCTSHKPSMNSKTAMRASL